MKIELIPAEVTSLEDTIVGKLTIAQLILICLPLFLGLLVFLALPPLASLAWYKLVAVAPVAVFCGLGALRVADQLLLQASLKRLAYQRRTKVYLKHPSRLGGNK